MPFPPGGLANRSPPNTVNLQAVDHHGGKTGVEKNTDRTGKITAGKDDAFPATTDVPFKHYRTGGWN